jgi:hypothetical protein
MMGLLRSTPRSRAEAVEVQLSFFRACDDGAYILGDPQRGAVWAVNKVELDSDRMPALVRRSRRIAVRTVWE